MVAERKEVVEVVAMARMVSPVQCGWHGDVDESVVASLKNVCVVGNGSLGAQSLHKFCTKGDLDRRQPGDQRPSTGNSSEGESCGLEWGGGLVGGEGDEQDCLAEKAQLGQKKDPSAPSKRTGAVSN